MKNRSPVSHFGNGEKTGAVCMERKKHKRLTFQIIFLIFLLFDILIIAIIVLMYQSLHIGFMDSREENASEILNNMYNKIFSDKDPELFDVYMSGWEKDPEETMRDATKEETDHFYEWFSDNDNDSSDLYTAEWINQLPEDIKKYWINQEYHFIRDACNLYSGFAREYIMFCVDVREGSSGTILFEFARGKSKKKLGDRFDYDIMQSHAIKEIMNRNSDNIVFYKTKDLQLLNYYNDYDIGYKPIIANGKVIAVVCLAYDMNNINIILRHRMYLPILISASGLFLVLVILYTIIYRKAVKPITKIETALAEYTNDKNSKKIVKHMYDIKSKNEIGYLADVVSDLALEIDAYTKENLRIMKELYDAEVQIMMSQIRPHFMYNALTSIAMMCEIDPKTAKEATIHFSKYLRCNMDSLKQTAPVPFTQELEHLKNYLYIEKLRFDDLLNIEYDIQTTDFDVPLLSIQPLVENAVKHGVGMAEDGGTVTIATRETDDAYEVIISDDGVGFDPSAPKKDDGRSHVGMENTKKRLKELCNADIIITSQIGEGTTAKVIIPKKREEEEKP